MNYPRGKSPYSRGKNPASRNGFKEGHGFLGNNETKEKLSKANKGENNYFFGKKFKGEKHTLWKGNAVGYSALHSWIKRELGNSDTCEYCGKSGFKSKQIHWANKSREYKRNLKDWLRLCAKCHWHYDRERIV